MPRRDTEEFARSVEADAGQYPDDRGEILLEAMDAWRRAGRPDRAREIADDLIAGGGDDACYARVERVELALDADDWDAARADLDELARQPALDQHHCLLAAELLEERGSLDEALTWFDRSVARFDQHALDAITTSDLEWSPEMLTIRQRRALRARLGHHEDATDALAVEPPEERLFGSDVPVAPRPLTTPRPRMLIFRRDERGEVRRRWPDVYDAPDDEYYATVELGWRDLREDGLTSIVAVPGSAEGLAAFAAGAGGSPTDGDVTVAYTHSMPASATIVWPPERNAPCWCGSGTKYKKCCGRPDPRPA